MPTKNRSHPVFQRKDMILFSIFSFKSSLDGTSFYFLVFLFVVAHLGKPRRDDLVGITLVAYAVIGKGPRVVAVAIVLLLATRADLTTESWTGKALDLITDPLDASHQRKHLFFGFRSCVEFLHSVLVVLLQGADHGSVGVVKVSHVEIVGFLSEKIFRQILFSIFSIFIRLLVRVRCLGVHGRRVVRA